jgi:hypothetical protein
MGRRTVRESVSGDLCQPIVLERHRMIFFFISESYVVLSDIVGYARMGKNHSHSIVPGGFEVMS